MGPGPHGQEGSEWEWAVSLPPCLGATASSAWLDVTGMWSRGAYLPHGLVSSAQGPAPLLCFLMFSNQMFSDAVSWMLFPARYSGLD